MTAHNINEGQGIGSIKCGAKVDVTLCEQDFVTKVKEPAEERKYECNAEFNSHFVGASQENSEV